MIRVAGHTQFRKLFHGMYIMSFLRSIDNSIFIYHPLQPISVAFSTPFSSPSTPNFRYPLQPIPGTLCSRFPSLSAPHPRHSPHSIPVTLRIPFPSPSAFHSRHPPHSIYVTLRTQSTSPSAKAEGPYMVRPIPKIIKKFISIHCNQ
ncbi:Uncharacterised protein [Legionella quateirensis]|uniref:Uncharacterized protein n=1 Tax=Legionella quateirensis TaxID=45072 RepID=A0A378KY19_9GAMM|nr:hypothetical protein Lqua_2779 [Legionella quateirensis]STY19433.1 Uncharacterised protein [Legionella quateirensis]